MLESHESSVRASESSLSSDFLQKLNIALTAFIGSHSFHNFHKLSPKDLRRKEKVGKNRLSMDSSLATERPDVPTIESTAAVTYSMTSVDEFTESGRSDESVMKGADVEKRYPESSYEKWEVRNRDITEKTRGVIFLCEAEDIIEVGGVDFVRIRIRGQSFLLQ